MANSKFKALIRPIEIAGVEKRNILNIKVVDRSLILGIGSVITQDLMDEINMAGSFGLMIDDVTDFSLIEQLVCFIQVVVQ